MNIDGYIAKHHIQALVESEVNPPALPRLAYSDELLLPTFVGANPEGTIFVTIYKEKGFFVAYKKGTRRIIGKIGENLKALDA
jgi:hypothetical protein